MITDKQWECFCWDVYDLVTKQTCKEVSLKGKRIECVDLIRHTIKTTKQGEGHTVYTKEQSINEYTSLRDLYSSVYFTCNMADLYKIMRDIDDH